MATMENEKTLQLLNQGVFSLSVDGGSKRLSKTYPILAYVFNPEQDKVTWKMLDVGTLDVEDRATGENIFALVEEAVSSNGLKWERCLALSVDNAKVMTGANKGVFGRVCNLQPACHLSGCVCHLLSITAQVGSAQLNYNISNLLQDIWHYLDKSNVRQGSLHKIQGEEGRRILKNAPSRWLDLGRHCPRLLEEWDSLRRFFSQERASLAGPGKTTSEPCDEETSQRKSQKARLLRTEECLNSRECKLDALFLQYIMAEIMDPVNKHFQTTEPLVATTRRTLEGFIRKLQSGFVQPSQTRGNLPSAVNHTARSHQKADEDLLVGDGVKAYLMKLHADAKAEQSQSKRDQKLERLDKLKEKFFHTVRLFYSAATSYTKKAFPLTNPLLQHAEVADTTVRDSAKFSSLEYFLQRYPAMLPDSCKQQDLQREFTEYQELSDHEVPSKDRMDSRWTALATLKDEVGALKFTHLPRVMLSILSIPVSQAEAERQFSVARKNWDDERSEMAPDTLKALLTLKASGSQVPCHQKTFTNDELKRLKSAYYRSLQKYH